MEERWAEEQVDRLAALAAELARLPVQVIVTARATAIQAATQATQTIPIVMAISNDPVAAGFVASLARPGGNVTGLSTISPGLSAKRLEWLREALPALARIGVVWNPAVPDTRLAFDETVGAARTLGVELQLWEVRTAGELERTFELISRERPDGLLPLLDSLTFLHAARIAKFAVESRLPAS